LDQEARPRRETEAHWGTSRSRWRRADGDQETTENLSAAECFGLAVEGGGEAATGGRSPGTSPVTSPQGADFPGLQGEPAVLSSHQGRTGSS